MPIEFAIAMSIRVEKRWAKEQSQPNTRLPANLPLLRFDPFII